MLTVAASSTPVSDASCARKDSSRRITASTSAGTPSVSTRSAAADSSSRSSAPSGNRRSGKYRFASVAAETIAPSAMRTPWCASRRPATPRRISTASAGPGFGDVEDGERAREPGIALRDATETLLARRAEKAQIAPRKQRAEHVPDGGAGGPLSEELLDAGNDEDGVAPRPLPAASMRRRTRASSSEREPRESGERPRVDLEEPRAREARRDIAVRETLGERTDDRSLPDARLSDEERMTFVASLEDRDQAPELGVASDHGIALLFTRLADEISHLEPRRVGRCRRAARRRTCGGQVRLERPRLDAERRQDLSGGTADLLRQRVQQMVDTYLRASLTIRVAIGATEQIEEPRRKVSGPLTARRRRQRPLDGRTHVDDVRAGATKGFGDSR